MAQYSGNRGRREELARLKGFSSYSEYRKAPPDVRARATAALAGRDPSYARSGAAKQAADKAKQAPPTRETDLGAAGTSLETRRETEMRKFLNRAIRNGERIYARLTIRNDTPPLDEIPKKDRPHSEVELWSKGGVDPEWLRDLADALGSIKDAIAAELAASLGNRYQGMSGEVWTIVDYQLLARL